MAIKTKASVKAQFETGDKPTQTDFSEWVDTCIFTPHIGGVAQLGVVEVISTASSTGHPFSTIGSQILFTQSGTGAVARSLDSKLEETVSVTDFGAVGDGTTDDLTAFTNAVATGLNVYVPEGTYLITNIITLQNEQKMYGDGVTQSIIKVDAATFTMGAIGIVRLGTSENGAEIDDIGIECVQDSTESVRANVNQYPPAIYAVATPRFRIGNLRISGAWDGIDATGNSGGSWLGRIEVGALNKGLQLNGSSDFIHGDSWHFWPFGMTTGNIYNNVYLDGDTIAAEIGDVHSLSVGKLSTSQGKVDYIAGGSSILAHQISNLQLDGDNAILTFAAQILQVGELYSTNSSGTVPSIAVSGGRLLINQIHIQEGSTASNIKVTGGLCMISGGYIVDTVDDSIAAEVTAGILEIRGTRLAPPDTGARTNGFVKQSGTGVLLMTNCSSVPTVGGSGPLIEITADNASNFIADNSITIWDIDVLADAILGRYFGIPITFTPVIADASSGGNASPTAATGTFTLIDEHHARYKIVGDGISTVGMTGGDLVFFRDLPFTSKAGTTSVGVMRHDAITYTGQIFPMIVTATTWIIIRDQQSGGSGAWLTVAGLASTSADFFIDIVCEIA